MTTPVRLQLSRRKGSDRPIIMSGPMVRAIKREIAAPGTGKTQTRRIIPLGNVYDGLSGEACDELEGRAGWRLFWRGDVRLAARVPYAVGDRLWVRETVACGACAPSKPSHWAPAFWRREQGSPANPSGLWYAADGLAPEHTITDRGRWVPSIHMPRWASRLTLIVTDVRVERLQDISEADADAECFGGDFPHKVLPHLFPDADASGLKSIPECFAVLWNSLHGPDAWKANPWVAAITFRPILANIDSLPSDLAARPACDEVRP